MALTIHRLDPTIPVETPKGRGEALAWFDYSSEFDLFWLVALDQGGACWLVSNKSIRLCENISVGRTQPAKGLSPKFPRRIESLKAAK